MSIASRARGQVPLQLQHFGARDNSIQIRREHPLRLGALQLRDFSCARRGHESHGHEITSALLPPPEPSLRRASFFCTGALNPNSSPTSRTYGVSFCRNASRPRVNRDFTVPSEISCTSAISSYVMSSRSRRISVVRYGSVSFLNS